MNIAHHLYPFDHHYADLQGLRYHYLDEGKGETLVMVHGNPTWSFYYRNLVLALRDSYRTVVPDHIGCGFSDKPDGERYPYTLERRVDDLEAFLEQLDLPPRFSLVLHDWGGMIGMAYAKRHPERIARLVLLNTAAFHLPASKGFPWQLWLTRTPVGTVLVRGFNAFSRAATHLACTRKTLPKEVRDAYAAPYNSWDNRIATLRFVQDIPLRSEDPGYQLISDVQNNLSLFEKTPTLICWGDKDFVFDHHFLRQWQKHLPNADIHRFVDCGHYVLEDASDEILPLVKTFLKEHPL
jgi:cis-3-alkyl-4-acyloxetan-2-one decarboxylase